MNNRRPGAPWLAIAFCCLPLLCASCGRSGEANIPPITDDPRFSKARMADFPRLLPAYGVAMEHGSHLDWEVNVEAEDSRYLRRGLPCAAERLPSGAKSGCQVEQILRNASEETGQAIAWLKPTGDGAKISRGEFVSAEIRAGGRRALAVPDAAILVKNGTSFIIVKNDGTGKEEYRVEPVGTGAESRDVVEITSGNVRAGDWVMVDGGIGLIHPGFKQAAD